MNNNFLGLNDKYLSMFSYAGLFVTGLVVLIFEKKNKRVRFNAMQSFICFLFLYLVYKILGKIILIGFIFRLVATIAGIAAYILLILKSYQGELYKLPIIGDAIYNVTMK